MLNTPLEIPTGQNSLTLREFTTPADDRALFELTKDNAEFWETYASDVVYGHSYLSWVREARLDAPSEGEHRLGIYSEEALVGWATITDYSAYPDVGYWCGIWLDQMNTGKGYGTMAIRSMVTAIRQRGNETPWVSTSIHEENIKSRALFERVRFSTDHGRLPYQDDDHIAYKLPPSQLLS